MGDVSRIDEWFARDLHPEDGKTYRCMATLSDDGKTLEIRGYIGVPMLGRTQAWTRVESLDNVKW